MSLFKKPKKSQQQSRRITSDDVDLLMDTDEQPAKASQHKELKKDKPPNKLQKPSLLSFEDEEEEGEVFQVKKSSYSKRIHKEKRRKHKSDKSDRLEDVSSNSKNLNSNHENNSPPPSSKESNNFVIKEIESEGFSIRLKNSNPENFILNGRAALCAGRDEISSEEEEENFQFQERQEASSSHRFSQPENFTFNLESGAIPDAAMIHAARKRRQKAREQGDFIPVEDSQAQESKTGKRNIREEDEPSSGEEERVDMSAITGAKEIEERRQKFYSVQHNISDDDSDNEMREWENQQIRKGVTGAQLLAAQDSIYSQFIVQPFLNPFNSNSNSNDKSLTTSELLEQAYSHTNYEIAKQLRKDIKKESSKAPISGTRTPKEIFKIMKDKMCSAKELNHKHFIEIDRICDDFKAIAIDLKTCEQNGPMAAGKYRFYQELKIYIEDLIECLSEKLPIITSLEARVISVMEKYSRKLIERRRQDVRDQAKELTDTKSSKRSPDDEERTRRAAEREGRRTRRRRDREKLGAIETHNDGMSSDDEVPDVELAHYKSQLSQINSEATSIFEDVADEYFELALVLQKFDEWKKKDLIAYKEAFVHLCLPKITSVFVRAKMIMWSPFEIDYYEDIEKMDWFRPLAMYGRNESETEESLRNDPDVFLIPTLIEKIILPKLNKIIEECWDPLSTTQTLKLVKIMNQLSNDYPSLRVTSMNLHAMINIINDKMKAAVDTDVFIPIFQKQNADSKSSFFQRQFYSGVKLFRNLISFQGIISDKTLKNYAISSLLNRYLLSAMRVSNPVDGVAKAYTIILTLPRVWLTSSRDSGLSENMTLFSVYVRNIESQFDRKNPMHIESFEKLRQISCRLELIFLK